MGSYSLSRELGTMFGFLAACLLTVGVYYIIWQALQRRATARDEARRKDLHDRGFHHERGGYHDKALHRYASRDPIAQSQGQTLEFLTEPSQYPGMTTTTTTTTTAATTVVMSSGSSGDSSSNSKNDINNNSNENENSSEDEVAILPWNRFTDYQDQHYGNSGAGLRIDSAIGSQKSQVEDETPSTIHNEMGNGHSARDLF